MKNLLYILLIPLIFGCSSEEEAKTDVFQIKDIGILSTTEYTLGKVIHLNHEGEWYKFGDRKILISTKAKVKAGVDLNKIKQTDIKENDNTIEIVLPEVEITSFVMNPEDIHTEMKNVTGLRDDFEQTEINEILRLGEKSIRAELANTELLTDARKNAISFVKDFYNQLGYDKVIVTFKTNE